MRTLVCITESTIVGNYRLKDTLYGLFHYLYMLKNGHGSDAYGVYLGVKEAKLLVHVLFFVCEIFSTLALMCKVIIKWLSMFTTANMVGN